MSDSYLAALDFAISQGLLQPPSATELERLLTATHSATTRPAFRSGGRVEPTEAQKEAGNYRKDHIVFQGLPISIETKKGQKRSGRAANGREWSVRMPADYGYLKCTEGADGDHVDVYVGPDKNAPTVWVVDQIELGSRKFDEHKCMLGFKSRGHAEQTYRAGFSDGKGGKRIGAITAMSVPEFKRWLEDGETSKPYSEGHRQAFKSGGSVTGPNPFDQFDPPKGSTAKGEDPWAQFEDVTPPKPADPWAAFELVSPAPQTDPWAEFRVPAPPAGFVKEKLPADRSPARKGQEPEKWWEAAPLAPASAERWWEKDPIVPETKKGNAEEDREGGAHPSEADKPGMGETALRGIAKGLTFGLNDESLGLMRGLQSMIRGEGFSKGYDEAVARYRARDKEAAAANPVTSVAGELVGGMGTGLGAARSGLTLMQKGMSLPKTMMAGAAEGAGYGAAHGAGSAEGGAEERLEGALQGGKLGAGIGAAVPVAGRAIGQLTRAVTPLPRDPARQAMVSVLEREGIPLTAGQKSGSQPLLNAESILGASPGAGAKAGEVMGRQAEAFTDAALRRAGASGRAEPATMAALDARLGGEFRRLSANNSLRADQQLGQDLVAALREYDVVLPAERRQIVGRIASDIVQRFNRGAGAMPGKDYQTIRSRLSRMAKNNRQSDPDFAEAVGSIRDALDEGMNRSIRPQDAGAWSEARRQYGNMKTLEKAASGAGSDAALGLISPSALRNAAAVKDRSAYVKGRGDFAELARAGEAVMKPLPNSGTAQRLNIAGMLTGQVAGGIPGIVAGALVPGMAGRALYSKPVQSWLGNQVITPVAKEEIEAIIRNALQGGSQTQSPRLLPSR